MEYQLKVLVETRHFRDASKYTHSQDCPLYHALREIYPEDCIAVGSHYLSIGNSEYRIIGDWAEGCTKFIEDAIEEAHEALEVASREVELELIN